MQVREMNCDNGEIMRDRKKNRLRCTILIGIVMLGISIFGKAQSVYGMTGLLHAPTADMQRDKTFMFGGSFINENATPGKWRFNTYTYNTFNYYLNITILLWLEVGYNMVLNKGIPNSSYWPKQTWRKFSNQDRSFHFRLRLWKEGWWKLWTPQIVFGANDPATHDSYGGGNVLLNFSDDSGTNNYLTRWYLATTKHFAIDGIGELGVHLAFNWGRAKLEPEYKLPSVGVNFQFRLSNDGVFIQKAINGLNLMAEVCPKPKNRQETREVVDVGLNYKLWKDYINLIAEMNECKYFVGGIQFKVHFK